MIVDFPDPRARRHAARALFFFLSAVGMFAISASIVIVDGQVDLGAKVCAAGIIFLVLCDVFRKLAKETQDRADRWRENSRAPHD
jgi:hypothetical protein